MKEASSGSTNTTFLSRLAIAAAFTVTLLSFATAHDLRAEMPPDQVKAAGAIPLTTDLLDKMDKFVKNLSANDAAKAELAAASKDPSITPETWGSVVAAKCPKTVEVFTASGLTPDEFGKGIFTLMAIGMGDDFSKSEDKTVQANAAFFAANKERANAIFGSFISLGEPAASSPPPTP